MHRSMLTYAQINFNPCVNQRRQNTINTQFTTYTIKLLHKLATLKQIKQTPHEHKTDMRKMAHKIQ